MQLFLFIFLSIRRNFFEREREHVNQTERIKKYVN